jgi:DNA-binding MarR family transcriptional regulator
VTAKRNTDATYTPRIEDCVSFLIGKTAQQITRRARDALADLGITPVQYAVLNVLWEKDGQSLAEIGARLVLDSATMTGVADRLEASGMVSREAHPNGDRRVSYLQLAEAGRALSAPAQAALERVNREVAGELGEKAADFWAALRQIGNVRGGGVQP